jgi:oxygen-independent coproporphyrinogen-3 oxidase
MKELNLDARLRSHHDVTAGLSEMFPARVSGPAYLRNILETTPAEPAAIYLHVPYCAKICGFCNLNRGLCDSKTAGYHKKLIAGIQKAAAWPYYRNRQYGSVYFGGGTPTVLSAPQLRDVLGALHDSFALSPETEISVETSISELTDEKLAVFKDRRVNRLSVGVQSFQDRSRRLLGRRGSADFAAKRISEFIAAGFRNTGIDLIYNYPDQTPQELGAELETALSLDIAGASVYALILMKGSSLEERIRRGAVNSPGGLDREKIFFNKILGAFRDKGFEILEPTKFVFPGRDAYIYVQFQNSWKDVLAIGTGAGGRIGDYVYYNAPVPMPGWDLPVSRMGRVAPPEQVLLEKIAGGFQFGDFSFPGAEELKSGYENILAHLEEKGMITRQDASRRYSDEGLFQANTISRYVIMEMAEMMGASPPRAPARGGRRPRRAGPLRIILAALGLVLTGLGFAGIALPLLPATPFFLGALFFFDRSSPGFHAWLMRKTYISAPIMEYRKRGGLTARRKIRILAFVFAVMSISALLAGKKLVWLILAGVFTVKLFLFTFVIKTVKDD